MPGRAGDGELPRGGAASRDDSMRGIAVAILESDGEAGASRCGDERLACFAERQARVLFIAGHDHDDVHRLQLSRGMKGLEGLDDDDVAALHVDDPRPARGMRVEALELLERAIRLEHRVEMSDQQNPRSGSGMIRDEMAAALDLALIDPERLEADGVQLRAKDPAHLPHTGGVMSTTVDIDDALEQRKAFVVVNVDRFHERSLRSGEACCGRSGGKRRDEQRERESESEDHPAAFVR